MPESLYLKQRREIKLGLRPKTTRKVPKTLPPKSVKFLKQDRAYKKIVKEMLRLDPKCEIREIGCQITASGLHHIVKRSDTNLCDPNNVLRACSNCNSWVERNPITAIKKGYSKSKHIV